MCPGYFSLLSVDRELKRPRQGAGGRVGGGFGTQGICFAGFLKKKKYYNAFM